MHLSINFKLRKCQIIKKEGDKKFYNTEWALAESTFLYHVKKELLKQDYDVIKKKNVERRTYGR